MRGHPPVPEIADRPIPCIVGGRVLNADRTEQRGARRGDITPMTALMSLSRLARHVPAWRRYEVHWEGELPPEQVQVIELSFFSEAPHSAIAETLGLPLGTVKSRLRLAMGRLRALLEDVR